MDHNLEKAASSVTDEGPENDDGSSAIDDMFKPSESATGLSGYLYKMTRDGRWQRRWFETNGIFLTYYKSRKREKLLAALSLLQVGDIKPIFDGTGEDKKEGLFTIQLNSRVYTLRAKNDAEAETWVKTLLQIKTDNPDTSSSPMTKDIDRQRSARGTAQEARPRTGPGSNEWSKSKGCFCCC